MSGKRGCCITQVLRAKILLVVTFLARQRKFNWPRAIGRGVEGIGVSMAVIYLVEDDESIRELEAYALENSGFSVSGFNCGADFFAACKFAANKGQMPDMVLLDIMLPGDDGLKILKMLRENEVTKRLPVILITAKSTELDKVKGLDLGADDYIAKPFGVMELISRVKAVLRRTENREKKVRLEYQGITLDEERRLVMADGKECQLTYKEFELLKYLLRNRGIVLSREKIMELIWGYDFEGESRTVDMHIKTLRQKLGVYGTVIKTVRNVGYKLGE